MASVLDHLKTYAKKVRDDLRANPPVGGDGAMVEPMLHDRFRTLVEGVLPLIFSGAKATLPNVSVEWRMDSIGRPDIAFSRAGLARAFVELKAPDKSIVPKNLKGHDKDQFERFSNLPTWALSNFHEITLYARHEPKLEAKILPAAALDPDTPDAKADRRVEAHDPNAFLQILEALVLAQPPAPKSAKDMATFIAYAARFVKEVVYDLAAALPLHTDDEAEEKRRWNENVLYAVREEFRQVLYERPVVLGHAEDEDFNKLFAIAFAQTLAYGLLIAREEAKSEVGFDAHDKISETAHPLLRATLRALMLEEIRGAIGPALMVLLDTVNAADPILLQPTKGRDPILYFYQDFLKVFDEGLWKRYGVIYTPVEVVRYQVAAMHRALEALDTDGLLDGKVLLLDPACGTGTYLIAAAEEAGRLAKDRFGGAAASGEVRSLTRRLFGLEIMVGPYAVAHYRLSRALKAIGAEPEGDRLNIFLADTLAPVGDELQVTNPLGFMGKPIVEERTQADMVKRDAPILAIFGNPPYRRLREGETYGLVGSWVADNLWPRYTDIVKDAGWGNELNTFPDLYKAFFAWSQWKLFWREGAPGTGVLCLITNRSYLTGHPDAGIRAWLRREFDRIDILDLRGDARGARPASVTTDGNLFDVEVGVAIITAWALGGKKDNNLAEVRYADAWAHKAFTQAEKIALLEKATTDPNFLDFVVIERGELEDFRPRAFEGRDWLGLDGCFSDKHSGIESTRDEFVYGFTYREVANRVQKFLKERDSGVATKMYLPTRKGSVGPAQRIAFSAKYLQRVVYRPFDRRILYLQDKYVDWHRPKLRAMWGENNIGIHAMAYKTGAGPAVFCHGLLPDRHAFSGRGGYVLPLHDRRPGGEKFNINLQVVAALSEQYQRTVTPEEVFDAIVTLLSALSYTRRFAADLEDSFPHVPFPADEHVFSEAVEIGKRIRRLQIFNLKPEKKFWTAKLEGETKDRTLSMPKISRAFLDQGTGKGVLLLNAERTLRLEGVPTGVWEFAVSGYRVMYRWLGARNGLSLDDVVDNETGETVQRQLFDLVARIAAYLDASDAAESVLEAALAAPLTKADLGLENKTLI